MFNMRKAEGELGLGLEEHRARKRARTGLKESCGTPAMETDAFQPNVGVQGLIKRRELVMLIEQTLSNLGFADVSEQLAEESGIKHETSAVSSFREAILQGDYKHAVSLLDKIGLSDHKILSQCKFIILEQEFLEVRLLDFAIFNPYFGNIQASKEESIFSTYVACKPQAILSCTYASRIEILAVRLSVLSETAKCCRMWRRATTAQL